MADKMMRMAGRTQDGVAKPLSLETDNNGEGVIRTVDAAPFAYDEVEDAKRVKIIDDIPLVKQIQLISPNDAVTIPAGERHRFVLTSDELDANYYSFALPAIEFDDNSLYTLRFDMKNQATGGTPIEGPMMIKLFEHTQTEPDRGMPAEVERFPLIVGDGRLLRVQITNDGTSEKTLNYLDLYLLRGGRY